MVPLSGEKHTLYVPGSTGGGKVTLEASGTGVDAIGEHVTDVESARR